MAPNTPYSKYLGDAEPVAAMRAATGRIRAIAGAWPDQDFERTYAPGKWTARQVLTHLAQSELALGTRVRMALTVPGYTAQPFEQDAWVAKETRLSGREALDAFCALSRMNTVLFESLGPAERAATLSHPEYGALTVDWVIHQMAGHQINHRLQIEEIDRHR